MRLNYDEHFCPCNDDNNNNAVANAQDLRAVESSPYYTARLNEAQLEEERQIAAKKAAYQTAVNAAKKF
jgi:hypothetical protein